MVSFVLAIAVTVKQILERDDFAKTTSTKRKTSRTARAACNPLTQAYDSVALEADVELGGLIRNSTCCWEEICNVSTSKESQVAMITPLLEGTDGVQKMSKSLGNYIGINEPPQRFWQGDVDLDEMMWRYFELCTDLTPLEIESRKSTAQLNSLNPRD
jgi:tyrosyl-tRNA synthetase